MKKARFWVCALVALAVGCSDDGPTDGGGRDVAPDVAEDALTGADVSPGDDVSPDVSPGGDDDVTVFPDAGDRPDVGDEPDTPGEPPGCAPLRPFDEGAVYTRTLYVDPAASGGDGSAAAPFGTVQAALAAATPGTDVVLRAGNYSERIGYTGLTGTAQAPIRIRGEDGAVLRGTTGMQLSKARYVVLEDLVVEGATQNGLNLDDGGDLSTPASDIVIRNVRVSGVGTGGNQDCIKMSGVDRFHIEGVTVSQCSGQGIDMVGCHDGVIVGNNLLDMKFAVQAKGGSADVLIIGNRFTRSTQRGVNAGGNTGLAYFRPNDAPYEAARIHVHANLFEDGVGTPIAFVGCDACTFVNNTVVRQRERVVRILQETVDPTRFVPSRNGLVANNIFVFNLRDMGTYVNIGPNTAPETFRFSNNLWHTLDGAFTGPTLGAVPPETNPTVADPAFVDADYRIAASSPAATAGSDAFDVLGDFAGRCWPEPRPAGAHAP